MPTRDEEDEATTLAAPPERREPDTPGSLASAGEEGGVFHTEGVEGGEELSIGGGPPSASGGTRNSPLPNRKDLDEE